MKKIVIFIMLLMISWSITSQNKWSFGLTFQPGISGLANRIESFDDTVKLYLNGAFSYSVNATVNYELNNKFFLSSGISFSQFNYTWEVKKIYYDPSFIPLMINFNPLAPYWIKDTYTTHVYSFNIPLNINFFLKKSDKFQIYLKAGFTAGYFFGRNSTVVKELEKYRTMILIDRTAYYKPKMLYAYQLGFGMFYRLSNHFKIQLEPLYQYYISIIDNTFPLDGHFYNIGVHVGAVYQF